jgi:dodecin
VARSGGASQSAAASDPRGRPPLVCSPHQEDIVPVARVTEISATSTKSFEDAMQQGVARACQTLRNVRSAWVKEHQVKIDGDRITEYQVNMLITFVLDEAAT